MKNGKIIYTPVGIIHTPYKELKGIPIQPPGAENIKGTVEIEKKFALGLKDLAAFSHVILIYNFHLAKGYSLEVIPFLDKSPHGMFATRTPKRPNTIGISVVRLKKIQGNKLFIENIDVIDGTPLLDIKPYVKEFDNPGDSKNGWLRKSVHKLKKIKADERFK